MAEATLDRCSIERDPLDGLHLVAAGELPDGRAFELHLSGYTGDSCPHSGPEWAAALRQVAARLEKEPHVV